MILKNFFLPDVVPRNNNFEFWQDICNNVCYLCINMNFVWQKQIF